ncbi:hypothetical protein AHMF7605_21575 [Adhaeribacter arboris]|uniref:Uncharacterized protein n=1 Tax=Adhaeribacter arboris TaxID=2072846 RepID=A0A2T2YKB1_9BACT|nr:hypothetical protein [Adhaeribacter arboris]PSR55905.1 hypothetical protein AHMF7605_21575 [Adhaeribacter arboris]
MENIPRHVRAEMKEIAAQVRTFQVQKITETLIHLGFTFSTQAELTTFERERMHGIIDAEWPEVEHLYVDYGTEKEIYLAKCNNYPEENEAEQLYFHDGYFQLPEENL